MSAPKRLDVNTMSPEALNQARQSVSAELEFMSGSSNSLRKALALFEQARVAAEKLGECKSGQRSLVPLTSSVSALIVGQLDYFMTPLIAD